MTDNSYPQEINGSMTKNQDSASVNIYRTIFELADDALLLMEDDHFIDCNASALALFGYTYEELIGQSLLDFSPLAQPNGYKSEQMLTQIKEKALAGQVQKFEWLGQRSIDELFYVQVTLQGLKFGDRTLLQFSLQDITERKQSEEQLRQLSRAVEQSASTIVITDTEGYIEYANPRFVETTGYTLEEAIGQHTRILKSGETSAEEYQQLWEAIKTGQEWRGEFHNRKKNGELYWESASISPIKDADGRITHYLAVKEEITERKQAEENLAKRATELQTVAQVATAASTSLETEKLLQEVVDLTKERFGLYHAHIYLLNETEKTLDLVTGTGEVGRQMVAKGWHISFDQEQSLVARAARTGHGVIVNDVRQDPGFLPQTLLPDTRSEMAVPLLVGGRVLGVLDVQSDKVNHFTDEDIRIKTTLAAQVAVALENAILHEHTQVALAYTQALFELSRELATASTLLEALEKMAVTLYQHNLVEQVDSVSLMTIDVDQTNEPEWAETAWAWPADNEETAPPIGTRYHITDVPLSRLWIDHPSIPVLFGDIRTDKRLSQADREFFLEAGVLSSVILPLSITGRWVGLLSISWSKSQTFTTEHERIYRALMGQIAALVESQRRFDQLQVTLAEREKQTNHLVQLNELSQALNLASSEAEILKIAAGYTPKIIQADRISIAFLSPTDDHFEVFALQGNTDAIPTRTRLPLMGTAVGQAVRNNAIIVTPDTTTSEFSESSRLAQQGLHSTMNAPLVASGQIIGTLNIACKEPHAFTKNDENLMRQISAIVASSLDSTRLFAQTQQRAAELEDVTSFLDLIIESIPHMVFVKEAQQLRFVRFNKAGAELLGVEREALIGKNDYDLFPKDEADFFTAKDRAVLSSGEMLDIPDESIHTQAMGIRLLHTRKVPIYSADGEPKYLLGISEDITERKAAEKTLLEREEQLRTLVEHAPEGIFVFDQEAGRFIEANNNVVELLGYSKEELLQAGWSAISAPIQPGERPMVEYGMALVQQCLAGEAPILDWIFINKAGEEVPVELRLVRLPSTEGTLLRASIIDVSHRKAIDAERERLLAEVQAAYQQYVNREWEQYLGEQNQGHWRIEYEHPGSSMKQEEDLLDSENGLSERTIVTPISLRGEPIGTLQLENSRPHHSWTAEDKALIEAVSEQLALTLENLRLFEDTQKRATREQLVRQITTKMRAAPDVDTIIQTGLQELAKALDVSHTYVKLISAADATNSPTLNGGTANKQQPNGSPKLSAALVVDKNKAHSQGLAEEN